MERPASAVTRSKPEVGPHADASAVDGGADSDATVLCVSDESVGVPSQDAHRRYRLLQLEGALVTARAEAVLLRRLLARAEELRAQDLVTLEEIEEACRTRGYEPEGGQPVALWIDSALAASSARSESTEFTAGSRDRQKPTSVGTSSRRFDSGAGFVGARECPDCRHTRCGEDCKCEWDAAHAEHARHKVRSRVDGRRRVEPAGICQRCPRAVPVGEPLCVVCERGVDFEPRPGAGE
jgi:hypothetical protein